MINPNFGKRPAGADKEAIRVFLHDTIVLKGETNLKKVRIFNPAEAKNEVLRSDVLPLAIGRIVELTHCKISHNLDFANPKHVQLFEEYSNLTLKVEDKDYGNIPLHLLLPYNRVHMAGIDVATGNTTKSYVALPKDGSLAQLPVPIQVPEQGKIEMYFAPSATELKTGDAATLGINFGDGIIDDADTKVFFIKIEFMGTLLRAA